MKKLLKKNNFLYLFVFILTAAFIFLPFIFKIDLKQFTGLGLLSVFIINFLGSATLFIPTPALISVGVAGSVYNPLVVGLVAAVATTLAELISYLFGYSSHTLIDYKKHKFFYPFMKFIVHRYGPYIIILFSFIPNPIFDGIGIVAGISGYSLKKFITLTFIGRIGRYITIAYIGNIFASG